MELGEGSGDEVFGHEGGNGNRFDEFEGVSNEQNGVLVGVSFDDDQSFVEFFVDSEDKYIRRVKDSDKAGCGKAASCFGAQILVKALNFNSLWNKA